MMIEGIYIIIIIVVSFLLIVTIAATIVNKSRIKHENRKSREYSDTSKMRFDKSGEIRFAKPVSVPEPHIIPNDEVSKQRTEKKTVEKREPVLAPIRNTETVYSVDNTERSVNELDKTSKPIINVGAPKQPQKSKIVISGALKDEILGLLYQNKKVQAIKRVREEKGLSLVDSKKIVEELESRISEL